MMERKTEKFGKIADDNVIDASKMSASASLVLCHNEHLLFYILNFCDELSRLNFIYLSSQTHHFLTSDDSFKWRLERLHIERGVYFPPTLPSNTSWKDIFIRNWKRRFLWENDVESNSESLDEQSFNIQVSARFKPRSNNADDNNMSVVGGKRAVLPLHQRLELIRMNRKLDSNKEAFEVLKNQGGWFGEEMKDRFPVDDDRDPSEIAEGSPPALSLSGGVQLIDDKNDSVILVDRIKGIRAFHFDNVVKESASQGLVYELSAMHLVTEFMNGYNATCIVYGQTGSGKTHTMFGSNSEPFSVNKGDLPESWGIVPRTCSEVFRALDFRKQSIDKKIETEAFVSYIEIYGNDVTDLLRDGALCGHNRATTQRYVLDGSAEVPVRSFSESIECLNKGEQQKKKAATSMNDRSSRAHSLFIITLNQKCSCTGKTSTSRLFLADLGGSEQLKKSQPFKAADASTDEVEVESSKQRLTEAININLGLLALKQCVTALRRKRYVPYSDSKLTLLLSPGLGGDSQTSVVVCGAQEGKHVAETIGAMRFGQVCRGISNTAQANANIVQDLFQKINDGIAECEENIKKHERWETREDNQYGEDGELIEVRKKYAVVGAEEWHERLTSLIRQKMELTGEDMDDVYANDSTKVQGFGNAHKYGMGKKFRRKQETRQDVDEKSEECAIM